MTVYGRGTTIPVEDAGVWALTRDKMESLQTEMKALRETSALSAEDTDYESLMDIYGEFLGRTNEFGQLTHEFGETGGYLLITVKAGYFPGWAVIRIMDPPSLDNSDGTVRPYSGSANITS
jgi:hypothetical protein